MKVLQDAEKALHRAINDELGKIDTAYDIELMALQVKSAEQLDLLLQVMQTAGGLLKATLHDRIAAVLSASGKFDEPFPFEAGMVDETPTLSFSIPAYPQIMGRAKRLPDSLIVGDLERFAAAAREVGYRNAKVVKDDMGNPISIDIGQPEDQAMPEIDGRIGGGGRPEPKPAADDTHPDDDAPILMAYLGELTHYAKKAGFENIKTGFSGDPAVTLCKLDWITIDGVEYKNPTRKLLRALKELAEDCERASTITGWPQYVQEVCSIKRPLTQKPPLGGLIGSDFEKLHHALNAAAPAVAKAMANRQDATTRMVQALRMAHEALARTTLGQGCDAAYFAVAEALELAEAEGLS